MRGLASQTSKGANKQGAKSLSPPPHGAIYREEEVVFYTYSIGGVEYYKKVLDVYKQVPRCCK